VDKAKAEQAEERVRQWREQKQLPFPDFAPAEISEFRDSLPYPPPESAVNPGMDSLMGMLHSRDVLFLLAIGFTVAVVPLLSEKMSWLSRLRALLRRPPLPRLPRRR